jgi:amino acid permease
MDSTSGQVTAGRAAASGAPQTLLSVPDGMFLVIGMVIGVGIFKLPSLVAGNTTGEAQFLFAWLLGGAVSLCGALVYAELSSRHPENRRRIHVPAARLGDLAAFLFVWSR